MGIPVFGLVIILLTASASLAIAAAAPPASQPAGPSLAGESHQIENVAQRELLRPRDANSRDGTPIVLYPHQDWKCMTWRFDPAGADSVRLVNYFTHKTFFPDGTADGAAVTQHPAGKQPADVEQWKFIRLEDGLYRLDHVATGKTLTVKSDGSITVEKWTGDDSQKWKLLDKPAHFTA